MAIVVRLNLHCSVAYILQKKPCLYIITFLSRVAVLLRAVVVYRTGLYYLIRE